MSESFASEVEITYCPTKDGIGSWRQYLASAREMGIREGRITPTTDRERLWRELGPCLWGQLETVRGN